MSLILPAFVGGPSDSNLTAASRGGTLITGGAANTKGGYSSLIDPTSVPSYGIWILAQNRSVTATLTSCLIDIAYGPTGGGNEQIVVPNINAGAAAASSSAPSGKMFFFPVYIPTGVRVSARCQTNGASGTVLLTVFLDQNPLYGFVPGLITDYGSDTANSRGTLVTAGTNAFGTWTQLTSSTSRGHRFWSAGFDQGSDSTQTDNVRFLLELGVGPDNANVSPIFRGYAQEEGVEGISHVMPFISYGPVPSGNAIWARLADPAGNVRGVNCQGID